MTVDRPNSPINPSTIRVRPLHPDDSFGLWRIRNLEEVRRLSNDPRVIPQAQHEAWFARYQANPKNRCFVLDDHGAVAGYCRIDDGLTSIALDPKYHGLGLGKRLLRESIDAVKSSGPTIRAEIRLNNDISLKLFTGLGFVVVANTPEKHQLEYRGH